jgi:hypothetical protein
MQIIEHPTEFHVRIEFDRFKTGNENKIKKIDGSRFSWSKKIWLVPISKRKELEDVQKLTRAQWVVVDSPPRSYRGNSSNAGFEF